MGIVRTRTTAIIQHAMIVLILTVQTVHAWQAADITATCGSTGNVIWNRQFFESNSVTMTQDRTTVLVSARESSGGFITRLHKADGTDRGVRYFQGITIGRPLIVDRTDAPPIICVAGSDGHVYAIDSALSTLWSRDLRRPSCSADGVCLTLCEQLRSLSSAGYQEAVNTDRIYVGTDAQCGTTTANKVYALNANTGDIAWLFNATGAYSVDRITGIVLDYAHDLVIVSADKQSSSISQTTLFALDAINGRRVWAIDIDAIDVRPVLSNNTVYVCTKIGTAYKLDPLTGSVVWSYQVLTSGQTFMSAQIMTLPHGSSTRLFVTTADGRLLAIDDLGTSATLAWTANGLVTTGAQLAQRQGLLYAGLNMNDIAQIGVCTGIIQNNGLVVATRLAPDVVLPIERERNGKEEPSVVQRGMLGNTVLDLLIDSSDALRPRLLEADQFGIRSMCIPWPAVSGTSEDANRDGTPDCLEGSVSSVDASDEATELLSQNQPNPFDGTTTIRFALARSGSVRLSIVNIAGQTIADLAQGEFEMGRHSLVWDGRDRNGRPVPTGLYMARLQTQDGMATIRMMLMR